MDPPNKIPLSCLSVHETQLAQKSVLTMVIIRRLQREHWSFSWIYNLCLWVTTPALCHVTANCVPLLSYHHHTGLVVHIHVMLSKAAHLPLFSSKHTCGLLPKIFYNTTNTSVLIDVCMCERERKRERGTQLSRSVWDDLFGDARLVTETRTGMCQGVARPRTRGWWEEDNLQEKARKKQLTHALLESLIIIRGMLTTDNYSVNPAEYLAISYCERKWCAWPRWCHAYYFE